jgi:cytochrome c-type biogenesis protein CcmH/NrfG
MQTVALILILFGLIACNTGNLVPEQETTLADVAGTERNANQAYHEEDWITAEREYTKLTGMTPTNAEPWFRLGNVYARLNRPNDALLAYREALVRGNAESFATG